MKVTVYHGSDEEFDSFDFSLGGSQQGTIKNAMHFTSAIENARSYGWYIYEVEISIPNKFVFIINYEDACKQKGRRFGSQELVSLIKKENPERQLIIIKDIRDPHYLSDIYILFNGDYITSVRKIRA